MPINAVLAFLLCCFAAGCVSKDEVARVPSPDGAIEAVVFETNGGATESFGYQIDLREKNRRRGERVAFLYGAVRNDSAWGVNVRWLSDRELRLEYLRAQNETLEKPRVTISGREVSIVLQKGIDDPSAPAGGDALQHGAEQTFAMTHYARSSELSITATALITSYVGSRLNHGLVVHR